MVGLFRREVFSLVGLFLLSPLFSGCPSTLYIDETFRHAQKVPVVDGIISLDRGETIEVKEILKKEKKNSDNIIITKLKGNYYLTAPSFKYIWVISPRGGERAAFSSLELPKGVQLVDPRFFHSEKHNCIILVPDSSSEGQKYFIHSSGEIGLKCSDTD